MHAVAPLIDKTFGESPLTVEYPGNGVVRFNAAIRVAIKRYNHAVTWATRHFISLISISKKYESNFKEISKLHLLVVIYECTSGQRKHRALKEQHYCQFCSLSMEMGRTATNFGRHLMATSTAPVFPRYQTAQIPDTIYTVLQQLGCCCSVSFLLGKDYEDHGTQFLCHMEESATLLFIYIYTVIEYGHFRLKFAGILRLTISQRVKSLQ